MGRVASAQQAPASTPQGSAPQNPKAADAPSKEAEGGRCPTVCEGCAKAGALKVVRLAPITLDAAANDGSTLVELQNVGSAKLDGSLCAGEFKSEGRPIVGDASFVEQGKSTPPAPCVALSLDCAARATLNVTARGKWGVNEAEAPLLLDGNALQSSTGEKLSLRVRKVELPFNLSVTSPDRSKPIELTPGQPLSVAVQNADALSYKVRWRLLSKGAQIAPLDKKGQPLSESVTLAPGANGLTMQVPRELFPNSFSSLFRPNVVDALLTIDLEQNKDGLPSAPQRPAPLVLSLERWPGFGRDLSCTAFCFFLLLVGGAASLFLNHGIPNAFRRRAVRRTLEPLAGAVKQLSNNVNASLRVELRVRRTQLLRSINKEPAIVPAASEVYEQAAQEAEMLARRVKLVVKIDERLVRIERMGALGPPELLEEQQRQLAAALRGLGSSALADGVLPAVDEMVGRIDKQLDAIEDQKEDLLKALRESATTFWNSQFEPAWTGIDWTLPWAAALKKKMGGFVADTMPCFKNGQVRDENLTTIDTAFAKLRLILEYVRVCSTATEEKTARFDDTALVDEGSGLEKPPSQRDRFFECLSGTGARTLAEARVLLREAEQGIFVRQVIEQVECGKFNLRYSPHSPSVYDPIKFQFSFYEDKFNDAAALSKLDCLWKFRSVTASDGNAPADLREECCWNAVQFFESPGEKLVEVEVRNGLKVYSHKMKEGEAKDISFKLRVDRAPDRGIWRNAGLEILQLVVALTVTLGALLSGAREQLQKLDPLTSMTAIIALGFGADVLKNMLSRRVTNDSPPAKAA